MNQLIIGSAFPMPRADENLKKLGYNHRTKYYHRIKYNGGFYTAFCESGTRITHFEELDEVRGRRMPCKKCFPKGEPTRNTAEEQLETIKEKLENALTTPTMNSEQQVKIVFDFYHWISGYLF